MGGSNIGFKHIPYVFIETAEETANEVSDVLCEFFNKDMRDLISEERFNTCKSGALYNKKELEILPHSGVLTTVLSDVNPFDGIENVTYENLIAYSNKEFNYKNFKTITY